MDEIINADCMESIEDVVSLCAAPIIVTDPPFNIGYHYAGYHDSIPEDQYMSMLGGMVALCPSVFVLYPEMMHKVSIRIGRAPERIVSWVYPSNTPRQHRDIGFYGISPDFTKVRVPYRNPNDKRIKEIMKRTGGARCYDWMDAIVTDPPYNLGFMGREWDTFGKSATGMETEEERQKKAKEYAKEHKGAPRFANSHGSGKTTPEQAMAFQSSMTEVFAEAIRVAKPGAYLLAFGGTRTYHRLACAIEDAGWEIRDCLGWLYGSGFPKSMDVSKAIDRETGYVGEVIGSRAVDIGMQGGNMHAGREHRVEIQEVRSLSPRACEWKGWGTSLKPAWEPIVMARKPLDGTVAHNVMTYGTGAINIDACRVGTDTITTQGGDKFPGVYGRYETCKESQHNGRFPANIIHDGSDEATAPMGDASRFFYCAKASKKDRGEGNNHPTVKPQALMQYLIRLVTPECAVVLDPFLGSGSTAVAAMATGRHYLGYELLPEYFDIARARLDAAKNEYTL